MLNPKFGLFINKKRVYMSRSPLFIAVVVIQCLPEREGDVHTYVRRNEVLPPNCCNKVKIKLWRSWAIGI